MRRLLPIAALLVLVGCDSNDPFPEDLPPDDERSCAQSGLDTATMSATTPSGSFRGVCSESNVGSDIEISVYTVPDADGNRDRIELGFRAFNPETLRVGTYQVDRSGDLVGYALYDRGNSTLVGTEGTITVTTLTPARIAGTFEFESAVGSRVTGGRFDVPL